MNVLLEIDTCRDEESIESCGGTRAQRLLHLSSRSTCRLLALFLSLVLGALSTSFLVSCLEWQRLLFDFECENQSLNTVAYPVGAMLLLTSWRKTMSCKGWSSTRPEEDPRALPRRHAWLCTNFARFKYHY